jgi:nitric oxide reductase NorD protein
MADRSLWFESHLLADRAGRRARQACEHLGPEIHQRILSAGDRLAKSSPAIAQQFYRHAADVWRAVGEPDFERWLQLGTALTEDPGATRDAGLAYFSVPARALARAGTDRLHAWCTAGRDVATVSRKLGATFFEGTAGLLDRVDAAGLEEWAAHGIRLHAAAGWRGEFLAQAYFAAAPHVLPVLTPGEFGRWADLGVALHPTVRERQYFTALPLGLGALTPDDRRRLLDLALALAAVNRAAAQTVYGELARSLRRLHGAVRSKLLQILRLAGPAVAEALAAVVPVVGALVHDLPRAARLAALELAHAVARQFPPGTVALLRSLPTAYENARHDGVTTWVNRGLEIAASNEEAGLAYFALESRTSLKVLHASSTAAVLGDVQGMLRKYVHMLSGRPVSIRATDVFQLRPPLEEFPLENEIALPLKVDVFPTHEENCDVYHFLAAQLAGRRSHGTYDADLPAEANGNLVAHLRAATQPALLEELFLLAEDFRVGVAVGRAYRGLGRQQQRVAAQFLARQESAASEAGLFDTLLACLLCGRQPRDVPAWLRPMLAVIAPCVAPLASPGATVNDALAVARTLAAELAQPGDRRQQVTYGELALDRAMAEALVDPYLDGETAMTEAPNVETGPGPVPPPPAEDLQLELDQSGEAPTGATQPLSAEELQRLLESGADLRIKQGYGNDVEGLGLYITDLLGKLPAAQLEELRHLLAETPHADRVERRRWLERRAEGVSFYYDEWDYHIGDYRQRWCRLLEVALEGDAGEFFTKALAEHAELIPEIRRQFQRIRPEMYRVVKGLEDGEDFDLNAVVDARVDRRARRAPSPKLYLARTREERDVATLFLIDMSASTDEPLEAPPAPVAGAGDGRAPLGGRPHRPAPARRIIDITKEALVLMAQALEEIGDAYAIYGFSGHGRDNVEFYMVKSFNEALSVSVRGRIGAIEPKRSTRMGTALRHATEKMGGISSRSRHIILLSDGFPQDFDYGQDRRSNVYGLRDTTVALRECEAAGIVPFCITVDKSGHDYLREMCDESRYMVIEDISALPRELPKIYQRVVGG